jgi:hypothetical protein
MYISTGSTVVNIILPRTLAVLLSISEDRLHRNDSNEPLTLAATLTMRRIILTTFRIQRMIAEIYKTKMVRTKILYPYKKSVTTDIQNDIENDTRDNSDHYLRHNTKDAVLLHS